MYIADSDIDTVRMTLLNPLSLLSDTLAEGDSLVTEKLETSLICVVEEASRIHPRDNHNSEVVLELDGEQEYEAIIKREEWYCVVLPAFGLAWVHSAQVVRIEEDELEPVRNLSLATNQESVVEFFGPSLASLRVSARGYNTSKALVAAILGACVNIQRLGFQRTYFCGVGLALLVSVLKGDLGDRLQSLNLIGISLSNNVFEEPCSILMDLKRTPALRELRLEASDQEFQRLQQLLDVNKTIAILELSLPPMLALRFGYHVSKDEEYARVQRAAFDRYQGECVGAIPIDVGCKAAFLSILTHAPSVEMPLNSLDSYLINLILKFAAESVRRRIL